MGMIISMLHLFRCSVFSYQRRFPVVYFTYPAMRRPRFVNKQHEVCAFSISTHQIANKQTTILTIKIKQL